MITLFWRLILTKTCNHGLSAFNISLYLALDCGIKPDKKKIRNKSHGHHKREKAVKRIVGGEIFNPGDWPWQVLLQHENMSALNDKLFCGGAILSRYFILTAGHCKKPECKLVKGSYST